MQTTSRYSDEVKRVKYEMDTHAAAGSVGWVAFALADGSPADHAVYESWQAAVKARKWDRDNFFYIEVQPGGMEFGEAKAVLQYSRFVHSVGGRVPAPDSDFGELFSSMPFHQHDKIRMAKQLAAGKPIDPNGLTNLPSERFAHGDH